MRHNHQKLILLLATVALLGNAMRAQTAKVPSEATSSFQPRQVSSADLKPRSDWRNVGRSTPEACFETLCWAQAAGALDEVANAIVIEDAARVKAQEAFAALPAGDQKELRSPERFVAQLLALRSPLDRVRVLGTEPSPNRPDEALLHWLNAYDDGRIRENKNIVLRSTADGWRQKITVRVIEPLIKLGSNRTPGVVTDRTAVPAVNPRGSSTPLIPGLVPAQELRNRGNATALAAFETIQWAKAQRDFATLSALVVLKPGVRAKAAERLAALSADSRSRIPEVTTPERLVLADWIAGNQDLGLQVHTETVLALDRIYLSGVRHDGRGVSNFDYVLRRTESGWQWLMGDTGFKASQNAWN